MRDLDTLLPHATDAQAEKIRAVIEHGSTRAASKALGCHRSRVDRALQAVRRKAAAKDPATHAHVAPIGYHLRGVSTLTDAEGRVKLQWNKTARDRQDPAAVLEAFRAVLEADPLPAADPAPYATHTGAYDTERMAVYPMGDPHLGMLAWHAETGNDFDLQIAERDLCKAVDHLSFLAPPTETALIANLGDFFHTDNNRSQTTAGTQLDSDSRWAKILRVGLRAMVRCIDSALRKHLCVRVVNEIGNHDSHASVMLSLALEQRYHADPRVSIDTSPQHFHWHEFGRNLLGVHHGDGTKGQDLVSVMAHDQSEAWGRTKHRYFYCGHVHHTSVKEYPGCVIETFRTLAGRDAWHSAKGYRSGRSMVCDVLHAEYGRVLRHEVGIEALNV